MRRQQAREILTELSDRIAIIFRPIEDKGMLFVDQDDAYRATHDASLLPSDVTKFEPKAIIRLTNAAPTSLVMFHAFYDILAISDGNSVGVWSLENGSKMFQVKANPYRAVIPFTSAAGAAQSHSARSARITTMNWVNESVESLLMLGSDDGVITVWKDNSDMMDDAVRMVSPETDNSSSSSGSSNTNSAGATMTSSFCALDVYKTSRGSGLVSSWQQNFGLLTVGGNSPCIKVWDIQAEKPSRVYKTGLDTCTTCLVSQSSTWTPLASGEVQVETPVFSWTFAGFADGSIGIFDQRVQSFGGKVHSAKEHSSWIVSAHLRCDIPEVTSLFW